MLCFHIEIWESFQDFVLSNVGRDILGLLINRFAINVNLVTTIAV